MIASHVTLSDATDLCDTLLHDEMLMGARGMEHLSFNQPLTHIGSMSFTITIRA